MYAILQQSGHQYRVSPGDRLVVDRLTAEVGSVVALEPVVLVANDDGTQIGSPVVDGVRVAAVVVSHRKGAKIRVFKYKPKKHYRRTHGHRSALTELRVEAVLAAGEPLPKAQAAEKKPATAGKARAEAPAAEKPARSRSRAKAAAPAEPEAAAAPEAAEAPEAEAAQAEASAKIQAAAEEAEAAGTTPGADADTDAEAAQAEKPKRTRTKKTPAADGGDTSPEA